jgi:hypothetical protein
MVGARGGAVVTFIHSPRVVIVWRSDTTLSAYVRDAEGVRDIRWTVDGRSCICNEAGPCARVLAVQSFARVAS